MSFKAKSYTLFKVQMAHIPFQAAPTCLPLVVAGGRCWGSQWEGLGNGDTGLGYQVHCPVPIYPIHPVYPRAGRCAVSRSEHCWREPSSKGPLLLTPPRPWTGAFSPVDPADAKPPSQTMVSAKRGSLGKFRPGALGDIHQQTI